MRHRIRPLRGEPEGPRPAVHPGRTRSYSAFGRRIAGLALGAALALGSVVGAAPDLPAAHAATFSYGVSQSGWFLGAYAVDPGGHLAYCVEPGGETPFDTQQPVLNGTRVLRGYWTKNREHYVEPYSDPDGLRQMAYIMNTYGKFLGDVANPDEQAAAVNLAVWMIRAEGDAWLQEHVIRHRVALGGSWVPRAQQYVAEARTQATPPPSAAAPQSPTVESPADRPHTGAVTVHPGTTTLTIASGIFTGSPETGVRVSEDRRTATITDGRGHTIAWQGRPAVDSPRGGGPVFDIAWERSGTGWPAALNIYPPAEDLADQVLAMGEPERVRATGSWKVSRIAEAPFAPVVTTEVDTVQLQPGEPYTDRVTFDVADDVPWAQYFADGTWRHREVTASGTLYGPMKARPERAADVPTNPQVPIAATATVTADDGPGTYTVRARGDEADEVGFYTWVWTIDAADQGPDIQTGAPAQWHIAPSYRFQDDFGIPDETHIRPMRPLIHTRLEDREIPVGGSTVDRVEVSLAEGSWLESDGARIPMTVRSTVYATDGKPEQQPTAPEGARVIGTQTAVIDHPMRARELSFDISVPFGERGGITVQTCVLADDQSVALREAIEESCDDWGIPEESAVIRGPEVVTQAQPEAAVNGNMHDTAIISGILPESPRIEVGFTAYLRPEAGRPKVDADWEPLLDEDGTPQIWSASEAAAAACEAQPVVETDRVAVTEIGQVRSPQVTAKSAGTVYWVEELFAEDPDSGADVLLHRGACGVPEETTVVRLPEVTTTAVAEALPGTEIFDTAHVSGPLSDREGVRYEVEFEAFHRAEGTTERPDETLCTDETRVWTSAAVPVAAAGSVESPRWTIPDALRGEVLWVETLWMLEDTETPTRTSLHRGACGAEQEITRILEPESSAVTTPDAPAQALAETGGSGGFWFSALGMLLMGAALFLVQRSRGILRTPAATTRRNHRKSRESGAHPIE